MIVGDGVRVGVSVGSSVGVSVGCAARVLAIAVFIALSDDWQLAVSRRTSKKNIVAFFMSTSVGIFDISFCV